MLIVDAQIHIWKNHKPTNPNHRQMPDFTADDVLAADTPDADPSAVARARKLQRFFAQPFYCAEPYTRRPGVTVSVADALRGCREIPRWASR